MPTINATRKNSRAVHRPGRYHRLLLLGVVVAMTAVAEESRWIDLTHDLSSEAIFWPTAKPFEMTTDFEGKTEKGYYYSAYTFCTAEHGGTHIDAPVHFSEGGHSVDQIPLEQLIGDAVVVDVSAEVAKDRDYLIGIEVSRYCPARQGRCRSAVISRALGSGGPLRIIARPGPDED